jgi:hypothetical protein
VPTGYQIGFTLTLEKHRLLFRGGFKGVANEALASSSLGLSFLFYQANYLIYIDMLIIIKYRQSPLMNMVPFIYLFIKK